MAHAAPPCLVAFHAHPDDEAIFTGGIIAEAADAGWRVVLVLATTGERGSAPTWVDGDLARRRRTEAIEAARILGIDRIVFLGYGDSGHDAACSGPPAGDGGSGPGHGARATALVPPALAQVDVAEAAGRLRRILLDEEACALTGYDPHGIYGHADHVRVHEIARAAVVGTGCDLYESTVSRPALRALRGHLLRRGLDPDVWAEAGVDRIGVEGVVPLSVDVRSHAERKHRALAAHASQVLEASEFMGLAPGVFHHLLASEWLIPVRVVDGRLGELLQRPTEPGVLPPAAWACR